MNKKVIYLVLQGRIGNQLFQYALARRLQLQSKNNYTILIDDSRVKKLGWINSLEFYDLNNVDYCHKNILTSKLLISYKHLLRSFYKILSKSLNFNDKFNLEKQFLNYYTKNGVFICENGYLNANFNLKKNIYLEGFFQSEKYFEKYSDEIKRDFRSSQFEELNDYNGIEKIRNRNSVCISIKIEHNIGNTIYSVCDIDYWKRAIEYIKDNIENPLFFICSDDVDFVIKNLIDTTKFDYIVQDRKQPVHVSLAAMSCCKHFIIGNTTFGWWAQYLSNYNEKIVCAPSRWMAIDMPVDIYQDNWHLIEV